MGPQPAAERPPHCYALIRELAKRFQLLPAIAEGVTFAGILNDLRYELAKGYLSEQGLSISRIAWLLGYQEVSAFAHAFKRKSGQTPNQVRRNSASAVLRIE